MRSLIKKLRQWCIEKHEINYLYFSIFFVTLTTFSLSHFLFLEHPLLGIRLFFLLYAIFQAFLEVAGFILIAYVLKRWAPSWAFFSFIGFSFVLLLVHFTDFTMLRLMDASISYLFKFLFGHGFDHLTTAFLALNMNLGMVAIVLCVPLVIPFIGVLLYWWTNRIAQLNPWNLSLNQIAMAFILTGGSLFFLELLAHPYLDKWIYNKHHKNFPLGATFLRPPPQCIRLPRPIAMPRNENETKKKIPALTALHRPNIYLFVIETLRRDFVNANTAPHLISFAQENFDFSHSYANANWTPLSWFAIFHSDFPYNWAAMRDSWKEGSIPLQLMKQLGYKIWVYTSADLRYFNMDRTIFGENLKLADQIVDHFVNRDLEPCDRDSHCIQSFEQDAKERGQEGNLYIFFLDSTHSEYSFPKDFPLKFEPIAKQIDYLTLTQKEIEPVKNRYRNSIYFIDSLMGRFFQFLKDQNLYESAVIAITGDHGEEFYEEGAFFHGTHLNRYQTEVPIFCKFPSKTTISSDVTHIDLFPSFLHYITDVSDYPDLFDGCSLFANERWPYRIAVLQNASQTPVEFSIEKGEEKIQVRFLNSDNIYNETLLEVIELKTLEDGENLPFEEILEKSFPGALQPLLYPK
ncbi:MAG TPA: sulfatase-like hydrolase/transferase [Chlamydiales bacterium]|nr:sulfatase-like hydrolase/transferase [Chlamydiales bacterium]